MHYGQHQQPANGSESSASSGVQSADISDQPGRQNGQKHRHFTSQRLRTTRLDFGAEIFPKRKQIQQQNCFGMYTMHSQSIILFRNCRRVFYYLTGFDFAFDSQECGVTGRKYTYEMLGHLIRKCGSALTRAGYKKGDVMAIISPNVPEFPVALLGAASVGMPVALVNPTFTPGMCQKIS
jgi:hypothetical protein